MKFGLACRGDIHGPWEYDFYGELWLVFDRAIIELGDKLAVPPSTAQAQLHRLCASGEVRAIGIDDPDNEKPKPIPPSEWHQINGVVLGDDDLPRLDVLVSNIDFYNWLNRQLQPPPGGKQSRLARLLAEKFPTGVPPRADYPREGLKAELLSRDPGLSPLAGH